MKKYILTFLFGLLSSSAWAVCPVCTVAVAGGLGLFEWIGIDNTIGGVWVGGLTVSLILWTASWLAKKGINSPLAWALNIICYYSLTLSVYFLPGFNFCEQTLCGIDKLLLGIILGSLGIIIGNTWYQRIKARNGGHAMFPYQKVVMPIGCLIAISLILAIIVY